MKPNIEKSSAQIEAEFGPSGLLLSTILVQSFAQGNLQDLIKGRKRTIENNKVQQEAIGRVTKSLASLLRQNLNHFEYDRYDPSVSFLHNKTTVILKADSSQYANRIYGLMEGYHTKYMKPVRGVYLEREIYDVTLRSVLLGVQWAGYYD